MYDILVYDMEVFKYDWFITLRSIKNNTYFRCHNDLQSLLNFYESNKNNIWAGHNINHYDNVILKCLLKGIEGPELKNISNDIIQNDATKSITKKYKLKDIQLYPMDVMQDDIR